MYAYKTKYLILCAFKTKYLVLYAFMFWCNGRMITYTWGPNQMTDNKHQQKSELCVI